MKLFEKIRTHNHILTRILSTLFTFTFTFLLSSTFNSAVAQEGGSFSCAWEGSMYGCQVNISSINCQPGFEYDETVCTNISDLGSCNAQINNPCQETNPESWYKCPSITTGCIPCSGYTDPGCVYNDYSTCDTACTPSDGSDGGGSEGSTINPEGNCENGVNTALGCIPYESSQLIPKLLTFSIGIAGGIALIIMFIGAFIVMTGGNNPEKVQKGKEIITSAIIGLLFIIFSAAILQIIAGDIIQIPGFIQ